MDAPLVSVVIANYNLGRFIGEAITSAFTQTHARIDVVIVDDGSTDDSVAIIEEHLRRPAAGGEGPARLVRRANGGVSRARNDGAAMARGEYLVFLDADDVLEPTYVARCLDALCASPPRVAYAYTKMRLFGLESGIFEANPFDRRLLLELNYVHASALMRRRAFDEIGGWSTAWSIGYEDHELWVRMLSRGYEGVFVPEPLLRYRRHGPSRNELSPEQLDKLHWKLILSQPRLYWRKLARHPLRAAWSALTEREEPT
jgi:glycosyltransferase involved in cell wall biosynthesis